jgi:hypothetical protein
VGPVPHLPQRLPGHLRRHPHVQRRRPLGLVRAPGRRARGRAGAEPRPRPDGGPARHRHRRAQLGADRRRVRLSHPRPGLHEPGTRLDHVGLRRIPRPRRPAPEPVRRGHGVRPLHPALRRTHRRAVPRPVRRQDRRTAPARQGVPRRRRRRAADVHAARARRLDPGGPLQCLAPRRGPWPGRPARGLHAVRPLVDELCDWARTLDFGRVAHAVSGTESAGYVPVA